MIPTASSHDSLARISHTAPLFQQGVGYAMSPWSWEMHNPPPNSASDYKTFIKSFIFTTDQKLNEIVTFIILILQVRNQGLKKFRKPPTITQKKKQDLNPDRCDAESVIIPTT